jgi:hypothetical protein
MYIFTDVEGTGNSLAVVLFFSQINQFFIYVLQFSKTSMRKPIIWLFDSLLASFVSCLFCP